MSVEILQRKLSVLLRTAVADCRIAEKTPGVVLDMTYYLRNDPRSKSCVGCMAGMVMMRHQLVTDFIPSEFAPFSPSNCEGNRDQLFAIDRMRRGSFIFARGHISETLPSKAEVGALLSASDLVHEGYIPALFRAPWEVYEKAAEVLEGAGL